MNVDSISTALIHGKHTVYRYYGEATMKVGTESAFIEFISFFLLRFIF